MAEHTQLIDAVDIRTSIRSYDQKGIDEDLTRQLTMSVDAIKTLAGIHIQLVLDQPKVFAQANDSGHFHHAANYLAFVGPKGDEESLEKAGFYGERLVLASTLRGLGSCWVGGSWDKQEAVKHCRVTGSEELYVGVIIGPPENHESYMSSSYQELADLQQGHRATKSFGQFTASMNDEERSAAPEWFNDGVKAAMKAPSARNSQAIGFSYNPSDDTASAHIDMTADDTYARTDLGIAKLHFEIGVGSGSWSWGDGGVFTRR